MWEKNHFNKGEKILSQKMWLRTIIEASEHWLLNSAYTYVNILTCIYTLKHTHTHTWVRQTQRRERKICDDLFHFALFNGLKFCKK